MIACRGAALARFLACFLELAVRPWALSPLAPAKSGRRQTDKAALNEGGHAMRNKLMLTVATIGMLGLGLGACTVEQTEEGNLPEYEVEQTEEGNLPEYDVDAADVEITTEQRTITVPDIDIEPADGDDDDDEPPAP